MSEPLSALKELIGDSCIGRIYGGAQPQMADDPIDRQVLLARATLTPSMSDGPLTLRVIRLEETPECDSCQPSFIRVFSKAGDTICDVQLSIRFPETISGEHPKLNAKRLFGADLHIG